MRLTGRRRTTAPRALIAVVLVEGGAAGGKLLASAVSQEGVDEQPPRNRSGTPPRPRCAARSANRAAIPPATAALSGDSDALPAPAIAPALANALATFSALPTLLPASFRKSF